MAEDDTLKAEQTSSAGTPAGDASASEPSAQPEATPAGGRRGVLAFKDDTYLFVPDDPQDKPVVLVQQTRAPSRWPAVIALACVAVASAVITAAVLPRSAPPAEPSAAALTPEATVVAHLTAVAGGKATEAMSHAARVPDDQIFLTDSVLSAAAKAHPLTSITAKETSKTDSTAAVTASFTIDGDPFSVNYSLNNDSGKWLIADAIVPADLTPFAALDAQLYGLRLGQNPVVALFPGRYELTTTHPLIGFGGSTFDAVQPGTKADLATLTPVLGADGATKVTAAITTKFDACLKIKELAPAGCGFGLGAPADGTVNKSTIAWKLASGSAKIADVKPTLTAASPLIARASTSIKLAMSAKSADGSWTYDGTAAISAVEADLTDPADIVVTFR